MVSLTDYFDLRHVELDPPCGQQGVEELLLDAPEEVTPLDLAEVEVPQRPPTDGRGEGGQDALVGMLLAVEKELHMLLHQVAEDLGDPMLARVLRHRLHAIAVLAGALITTNNHLGVKSKGFD